MANIICYLCRDNLAMQKYEGVLVSENGEKPCLECLLESQENEETEADSE